MGAPLPMQDHAGLINMSMVSPYGTSGSDGEVPDKVTNEMKRKTAAGIAIFRALGVRRW